MKFTLKTIYYILVGIFYRKDIRIVHYKMFTQDDRTYPIYMQSEIDGTVCESESDAIKRLELDKNITRKDRINMDRLLFGIEYEKWIWTGYYNNFQKRHGNSKTPNSFVWKYYWFYKLHKKLYNTFLSDSLISAKPNVIIPKDYNYAWWNILKFIKKYLMDYSNTIEHK